jgi:hypothetical protein
MTIWNFKYKLIDFQAILDILSIITESHIIIYLFSDTGKIGSFRSWITPSSPTLAQLLYGSFRQASRITILVLAEFFLQIDL